jgi:dTDP-4-amino-4,6-dideoxygalactose transaminase
MSLSFYDFNSLHPLNFKEEILQRFKEIMEESSFVEGKYNALFEQEFAKIQNAKHALLVANGTDALEISLSALGVKPGDKVGIPGITFYATAEAVLNVGATPVFIDVDDFGLMDPNSLKRVMGKHKLAAIMPVHIYGLPAQVEAIKEIAGEIPIIEDAAQAQGTFTNNGPVGSSGNLVTFSFYPTKNLAAFGDAGAILTSDDRLAEKIKAIRNHGRGSGLFGRNSRCDHMQAAVLHLKLSKIEKQNESRKMLALAYHKALAGLDLKLLPENYLNTSSWHLYPIRLKNKEERATLGEYLKSKGIPTAPFYEKSMGQEKALFGFEGERKVADEFAGTVLCLPIGPYLKPEDIQMVAKAIADFF